MIYFAIERQAKRYIGSVIALTILLSFSYVPSAWSDQHLVILNWKNYLDPQLVSEFETKHKTQVRQIFFNSDEERTERLLETNGRGYDLILIAGIDLKSYIKRGWLRPLNIKSLSNGKYIDPYWQDRFPLSLIHI